MWNARVTVDIQDNATMVINTGVDPEVRLFLPILRNKALDEPEGFSADALIACSKIVPEISGITTKFRAAFAQYNHHNVPVMLKVFDYTRENLLYDLYNEHNPGHLFVLMHCFGGWWAGVATHIFANVVLEECQAFRLRLEQQSNTVAPASMDLDLMFGLLACICKAFGSSARTPLIPHYPQGTPPDPIALFADSIASRYQHLKRPDIRAQLINALIDWHVPVYMRQPKQRIIWQPHNHIDRARAFLEKYLKQ